MAVVHAVIHVLLLLALPPLLVGVIARTKAVFAGRRGPPLLQPYYDLWKLARRRSVFSRTTTWVFRAGPVVGLAVAVVAGGMLPLGGSRGLVSFRGDFLLIVYLLGLGRFMTMAAALDTGSAFEGMGAAREATFGCLAEPALLLALFAMVRATGELSLAGCLGPALPAGWAGGGAALVLTAAGLFVVMLAENSRIPFDDPNTHLELTMVHEVMVLDHSGSAFGMILYGAALRLFVFVAIFVGLVVPVHDPLWAWPALIAGVIAVAIAIGVVESTMARLRLTHVPALLVAASLACALGVILLFR